MKTFTEANYRLARTAALEQIAWMDNQNRANAERAGGPDYLRENNTTDAAKRFLGIEARLIKLAAHDEAAEEYIKELSRVIEQQFETIQKLNFELRQLKEQSNPPMQPVTQINYRDYLGFMLLASPIPKKLGALLDHREGRRQASKTYAATTQPNLY